LYKSCHEKPVFLEFGVKPDFEEKFSLKPF